MAVSGTQSPNSPSLSLLEDPTADSDKSVVSELSSDDDDHEEVCVGRMEEYEVLEPLDIVGSDTDHTTTHSTGAVGEEDTYTAISLASVLPVGVLSDDDEEEEKEEIELQLAQPTGLSSATEPSQETSLASLFPLGLFPNDDGEGQEVDCEESKELSSDVVSDNTTSDTDKEDDFPFIVLLPEAFFSNEEEEGEDSLTTLANCGDSGKTPLDSQLGQLDQSKHLSFPTLTKEQVLVSRALPCHQNPLTAEDTSLVPQPSSGCMAVILAKDHISTQTSTQIMVQENTQNQEDSQLQEDIETFDISNIESKEYFGPVTIPEDLSYVHAVLTAYGFVPTYQPNPDPNSFYYAYVPFEQRRARHFRSEQSPPHSSGNTTQSSYSSYCGGYASTSDPSTQPSNTGHFQSEQSPPHSSGYNGNTTHSSYSSYCGGYASTFDPSTQPSKTGYFQSEQSPPHSSGYNGNSTHPSYSTHNSSYCGGYASTFDPSTQPSNTGHSGYFPGVSGSTQQTGQPTTDFYSAQPSTDHTTGSRYTYTHQTTDPAGCYGYQQTTGCYGYPSAPSANEPTGCYSYQQPTGPAGCYGYQQTTGCYGYQQTTKPAGSNGYPSAPPTNESTGCYGYQHTTEPAGSYGHPSAPPTNESTGCYGFSSAQPTGGQPAGCYGYSSTQPSTSFYGHTSSQPSTGSSGFCGSSTTQPNYSTAHTHQHSFGSKPDSTGSSEAPPTTSQYGGVPPPQYTTTRDYVPTTQPSTSSCYEFTSSQTTAAECETTTTTSSSWGTPAGEVKTEGYYTLFGDSVWSNKPSSATNDWPQSSW